MNYSPNTIFSDKTTMILREILANPGMKWTIRALANRSQTSTGLVHKTIRVLDQIGCLGQGARGRNGFFQVVQPDELVDQWTKYYDFSLNRSNSFYIPDLNLALIKELASHLKRNDVRHALTLHSGANLITNFFSYDQYHLYIESDDINKIAVELSAKIDLKRLITGGNIHFVKPHYRNAVFDRARQVKGINVVSNLQLYLDLFNFIPRGREHAENLRDALGKKFYE